jgi:peptidoglycan hydrolase-like protein with peptidoglycan-binding domain
MIGKMSILSDGQIQISFDNGDTWTSTPKNSMSSAKKTNYFDVYEKADGVKLKPTTDPNCMMDDSNKEFIYYIFNDGTYIEQEKTDNTKKIKGKMNILSDKSYNVAFENGDKYDSATNKYINAPTNTQKINTTNCANQLIDIANDPSKRKILKFGCKTQGVKELQTLLGVFGKDGVPTGYFGKRTKQAVIDFQTKNQLVKKEGIVGPETYKALTPNAVTAPLNENDDMYDDEEDSYNYLQSLFNTEDDYDGEPFRNDDDGFSDKMKRNTIMKKIKLGDTETSGTYYTNKDKKKQREFEKRKYAGLDPLRNDTQPAPYSPIKSDDLPLDKYLEKKKMGNLDEEDDEDGYDYLNSLFTKD